MIRQDRGVVSSRLAAARAGALAAVSLVASLAISGASPDATVSSPKPHLGSPHDIGLGLPAGFEPSGAVWHPRSQRLVLVGDEGTIAAMDGDGGSVRTWSLPGDLEGVCVADPESNRIYVAVERPAAIIEFDIAEGRVLRRFPLRDLGGGKKNKGPEALTFVPDASDREGGVFWLGLQSDGSIRVLALPLRSDPASTSIREVRRFTPVPGLSDISGLDWDPSTGTVWAIFAKDDLLVRLDPSGTVRERSTLPGDDQEGIAVLGDRVFITEDSARRVVRYQRLSH